MDPSVFHAPSGWSWGREGGPPPTPLGALLRSKTPYLAEKICESDRRVRDKGKKKKINLTNHRIVSLPFRLPPFLFIINTRKEIRFGR